MGAAVLCTALLPHCLLFHLHAELPWQLVPSQCRILALGAGSEIRAIDLQTDPALQAPLVLNTIVLLLAAALLLCCSYFHAELPATASYHARCILCCVATPGRTISKDYI